MFRYFFVFETTVILSYLKIFPFSGVPFWPVPGKTFNPIFAGNVLIFYFKPLRAAAALKIEGKKYRDDNAAFPHS